MKIKYALFDYGETLIHEEKFDPYAGTRAVLDKANIDYSDDFINELQDLAYMYSKTQRSYIKEGEENNYLEIPNYIFQSYLYDYYNLDIKFDRNEIEKTFWDAAAPYSLMPYTKQLLQILNDNGIKLGVISNLSFNGEVLAERLKEALSDCSFDPVISSADYAIRKPNHLIFDIALKKIGCKADEVIYVGDTYNSDIVGAKNVGMHYLYLNKEMKEKMMDVMTIQQLVEVIDCE